MLRLFAELHLPISVSAPAGGEDREEVDGGEPKDINLEGVRHDVKSVKDSGGVRKFIRGVSQVS